MDLSKPSTKLRVQNNMFTIFVHEVVHLPPQLLYILLLECINDRIATQRYLTPDIPIGSPVMSRTTSEPSDGRSRKMVANVAGCRRFCTFRDYHTSIAFTPVGTQPNLAHIFGWIWD